eukprot:Phypoly_transcript_03255.p1 GENE.Phypoly_transcript_03255~~Phypoly_transcript_03255.p1  ORF type:complete len:640 (+),score=100.70 Phypoly_transcript_03255:170-2089(+)
MDLTRCNFKRRKSQPTLLQRLHARETCRSKPSTSCLQSRKFYQNIVPNHTVHNVEVPNCHIKKFTSDGEFLFCFTKNSQGIQLYHFKGPRETLWKDDAAIHEKKFESYFTSVYEKFITHGSEVLNRDFCLQTPCGNFVILASSGPSSAPSTTTTTHATPLFPNVSLFESTSFTNPLSFSGTIPTADLSASLHHSMPSMSNLEDITFYLVGLKDGIVYDKRAFRRDYIPLAHHAGVYLYNDIFAVLSIQTQTIHLFQIQGSRFLDVRTIGTQCYEDDDLAFAQQQELERQFEQQQQRQLNQAKAASTTPLTHPDTMQTDYELPTTQPTSSSCDKEMTCSAYLDYAHETSKLGLPTKPLQHETKPETHSTEEPSSAPTPIVGLKQRLLAHLFRQAMESPQPAKALMLFHQQFEQYASLTLWKMQLLDEAHLLLKFGCADVVLQRSQSDLNNQTSFFVVYNMYSTEVIGVYENTNKEFAQTFEQFCEHFRACSRPTGLIKYRSTCSNNSFVREHLMKQKVAVMNARNGGETQAVKRILSALPFSPQSWSESPYFDKSLYNYDEKVISSTERPKQCADHPIKFYSRSDDQVQFKITPGLPDKQDRSKKYASYIFHPFQPFIISVQHVLFQPPIVNFHFRHHRD